MSSTPGLGCHERGSQLRRSPSGGLVEGLCIHSSSDGTGAECRWGVVRRKRSFPGRPGGHDGDLQPPKPFKQPSRQERPRPVGHHITTLSARATGSRSRILAPGKPQARFAFDEDSHKALSEVSPSEKRRRFESCRPDVGICLSLGASLRLFDQCAGPAKSCRPVGCRLRC